MASETAHDHAHGGKDTAGKAGRTGSPPAKMAESDSGFAKAAIWDSAAAEVLVYSVKRGRGGEEQSLASGHLVTERRYLFQDGGSRPKSSEGNAIEILNAVLSSSWTESGLPYSRNVAVSLSRRGALALLRQDESFQTPSGTVHRSLDCRVSPPRLRILPGGKEPPADSALSRWPLHTEEMLFTYVRSLPKRAGYREEIWMLDGAVRDAAPKVRFATLAVRGKMAGIREVDTWHVTLDREAGARSEFWISQSGLHPVVLAVLADGSEWTLREIIRRKIPDR